MGNLPKKCKCDICGIEFFLSDNSWRYKINRYHENAKFYCPNCRKAGRKMDRKFLESQLSDEEKLKRKRELSERVKKQWASYDEKRRKEIHEIFSNAQSKRIQNMSEEELIEFKKQQSEKARQLALNRTQEQKEEFSRKCSIRSKNMWANMSDNKRDSIKKKQSEGLKRYISSLSVEEKNKRDEMLVNKFANLSDDAKKRMYKKLSSFRKNYFNNLSEDNKKEVISRLRNGFNKYFSDDDKVEEFSNKMKEIHQNKTDEEKAAYLHKMEEWRNSLTPEEKRLLDKKRFTATGKHDKSFLEVKFEKYFYRHGLDKEFTFKKEHRLKARMIRHDWDYGIFNNKGILVMVVDVDSEYYHGDNIDYDGSHITIRYDGNRQLSVEGNIMIHIVYELNFDEGFKRMIDLLKLNYDEYVNKLVDEYKSMPLPIPYYKTFDLIKSYAVLQKINCNGEYHSNISINSRNGDMLCLSFHKSIWDVRVGELAPSEVWNRYDIILELVRDHILYHSYLNVNKILQGFDVSEKYRRKQFMSAGQAKMVINRYLSDYNIIFDPFSGYSGRLLGTISLDKQYIGQSNDELLTKESNEMIAFLHHYGIEFNATVQTIVTSNDFGCMFTEVDNDEMIDCCLKKYNCDIYVFSIKNTSRYTAFIIDKIFDAKLIRISKHSRDDIIHDI